MSQLDKVKEQWAACQKCPLHASRSKIVFSDGPETAEVMIIGEGPGATEDELGKPFTGPAGLLFEKILASVQLKRNDCYWTNAVRCRPPGNRTPLAKELNACRPLLLAEVDLIKPKVIIAAGSTAAKTLLGLQGSMASVAGKFAKVRGIPAIVIFHPAAILHASSKDPRAYMNYKRSVWESMKKVRALLDDLHAGKGPDVQYELGDSYLREQLSLIPE